MILLLKNNLTGFLNLTEENIIKLIDYLSWNNVNKTYSVSYRKHFKIMIHLIVNKNMKNIDLIRFYYCLSKSFLTDFLLYLGVISL